MIGEVHITGREGEESHFLIRLVLDRGLLPSNFISLL